MRRSKIDLWSVLQVKFTFSTENGSKYNKICATKDDSKDSKLVPAGISCNEFIALVRLQRTWK